MVKVVGSKDDFKMELSAAGDKLVVVDFYATWCGPCKMIAPKLEAMDSEMADVVFLKIDVDECDDLAGEFNISAMPTFLFFKNGNKIQSFSGANEAKIREIIAGNK